MCDTQSDVNVIMSKVVLKIHAFVEQGQAWRNIITRTGREKLPKSTCSRWRS